MKEEVGGYMDNLKLAYCNECEDLVEYDDTWWDNKWRNSRE